jgi:hypothetical protein
MREAALMTFAVLGISAVVGAIVYMLAWIAYLACGWPSGIGG